MNESQEAFARKHLLGIARTESNRSGDKELVELSDLSAEVAAKLTARVESVLAAARGEDDERIASLKVIVGQVVQILDADGFSVLARERPGDRAALGAKLKEVSSSLRASPSVELLERNPLNVALPVREAVDKLLARCTARK